jgi:hypothetical protein
MVTDKATSSSATPAVPGGAPLRDSGTCFVRGTQELVTTPLYVALQIADANGPSDATLSDEAQAEGTGPSEIDARTSRLFLGALIGIRVPDRTLLEGVGPCALIDFLLKQRKQAP